MIRLLPLGAALCALLLPSASPAWDVICRTGAGGDCPDPFSRARTHWTDHPRAEHRRLLEQTITLAGLPASFQLPFELKVFTPGGTVQGQTSAGPAGPYPVVRPVRIGANGEQTRELSIPAMASLPDFSYSLWDWASGNELCPPDPSNADGLDCHNYETHIGWLNSNHMVPQARRFYEHLHRLAIAKAGECKTLFDQLPGLHIDRFADYVRACERTALVIEAVAQHYLQDAWATGHMWERWGGPEIRDFDFDRALGFAVATLTGLIHGGKAALDDSPYTSPFGPWDDPMNAPHPDDSYVDGAGMVLRPGIGDRFLAELRGTVNAGTDYGPQRRALLGCAIDGVRAVYGQTAQFTGPMGAANGTEADLGRHVADGSCWDQRATNRAVGAGCGIHRGAYPNQLPIELDVTGTGFILMLAETTIAPAVANAPPLTGDRLEAYRADAAYACSVAKAMAADPTTADGAEMASGGLPAVLGVLPNRHFARGDAVTLPADWADPFLPWSLATVGDPAVRVRKEALNLTFADAHVVDRCRDLTQADLDGYRVAVSQAPSSAVRETRCHQCEQIVTPHLRFGRVGQHDTRREALCRFAGPLSAAFAYTGEDPAGFTGAEPGDLPAVRAATRAFCGCETTTTTTTATTSTTSTTAPGATSLQLFVLDPSSNALVKSASVGPAQGNRAQLRVFLQSGGVPVAGDVELTIDPPPPPREQLPETCPLCGYVLLCQFGCSLVGPGVVGANGTTPLSYITPPGQSGSATITAAFPVGTTTLTDSVTVQYDEPQRPPDLSNSHFCHQDFHGHGCTDGPDAMAFLSASAGFGDRGTGRIVMSVSGVPPGTSGCSVSDRTVVCSFAAGFATPGSYTVTVTATDSRGLSSSVVFAVLVTESTIHVTGPM